MKKKALVSAIFILTPWARFRKRITAQLTLNWNTSSRSWLCMWADSWTSNWSLTLAPSWTVSKSVKGTPGKWRWSKASQPLLSRPCRTNYRALFYRRIGEDIDSVCTNMAILYILYQWVCCPVFFELQEWDDRTSCSPWPTDRLLYQVSRYLGWSATGQQTTACRCPNSDGRN
jgi:hypothetical protein